MADSFRSLAGHGSAGLEERGLTRTSYTLSCPAGVHADPLALAGIKALEDAVVELDALAHLLLARVELGGWRPRGRSDRVDQLRGRGMLPICSVGRDIAPPYG